MSQSDRKKSLRAAGASIATAIILTIVKTVAGFFTGSMALLASALDSLLDSIISTANLITINAATKPPDAEHRFGHGKFEAFAELAQAFFVAASGLFLAYESIRRMFMPHDVDYELVGIGIMVFSILLTFALTRYLKRIARETNSTVLHADNAHFMSDLLANAAVIAGLLAVQLTGISLFDPLISLAIALVILYTAWGLLGESFQILTDHELPDETRKKIIEVLNDLPPPVTGWHLLRTRRVGTQSHVDYHLVLGEKVTLREAHDTAEKIEDTILEFLPKAVIMAHFDPDDDSERNMEMINNT